MRRPAAAVLILLAGTTTGCADQTESYCAEVETQQAALGELAGSRDVVDRSLEVFRTLREAAPEELSDEWVTYVVAWEGLADALESTGVAPGAFADGDPPAGLDEDEVRTVRAAADQLRDPAVLDAASGIQEHARQVCGVDLGGSGLQP